MSYKENKHTLIIFTDASYSKGKSYSTASIVYRLDLGDNNLNFKYKIKRCVLNHITCIHGAETYTILTALEQFKNTFNFIDNIIIISDSVMALRNVIHMDRYKQLINIYKKKGIEVSLAKVKAHNGSFMNELADKTARNINVFLKNHSEYKKKKKFIGWSYN